MKWSARDYQRNADQLRSFLEPVISDLGRIQPSSAAEGLRSLV